jgi:hypothetical protein
VDATEFLDCQMIYDFEDDTLGSLYTGPICASGYNKIKIGVFTDEDCNQLYVAKDVHDYIVVNDGYNLKLSHALLSLSYLGDPEGCILKCAMADLHKPADTCVILYEGLG